MDGPLKLWSSTDKYLPLQAIRPPALDTLMQRWGKVGSAEAPPLLSQVLGPSLRDTLGHMALVQMDMVHRTARYLVVGRSLVRLLGKNPTGLTLERVYDRAIARDVFEALLTVQQSGEPTYYHREFRILKRRFGYVRLLLPVKRQSGETDILLGLYPASDLSEARDWQQALSESEGMALAREMEVQWEQLESTGP